MLCGVITGEGKETDYRKTYILRVESINGRKEFKDTNLNLYVKKDDKLEYGQKISFIR